jgi:hypothetical protein
MDCKYKQYLLKDNIVNESSIITATKVLKNVAVIFHKLMVYSKSTKDTDELEEFLDKSIPELDSLLQISGLDDVYKSMIISGLQSIVGIQRLPIVNDLLNKYNRYNK